MCTQRLDWQCAKLCLEDIYYTTESDFQRAMVMYFKDLSYDDSELVSLLYLSKYIDLSERLIVW